MCICVLIGNLSIDLVSLFDFEALQQAHLLKSMGHNRQASDSSVDKFVSERKLPNQKSESKVRHWDGAAPASAGSECFECAVSALLAFSGCTFAQLFPPSHVDLESSSAVCLSSVGGDP